MKQLLNTLYVQTQGSYLHLDHDTLKLELGEERRPFQMPLHHLGSIAVFGNVLVSPFLIHRCAEDGRNIVWFSRGGRFKGRLSGPTSGNVMLRLAQHRAANATDAATAIARSLVAGKMQNARSVLLRAARENENGLHAAGLRDAASLHAQLVRRLPSLNHIDHIRGAEGDAARTYFSVFGKMVRNSEPAFQMQGRSRRPPQDRVNAMLSFVYAVLVNECAAACEGVGLDPQIGFLHSVRPGRPSLALDLMEELRAPLADRLVLTLINRKQVKAKQFIERPGGAVEMSDDVRRTVLEAYQRRKQEEIRHSVLERNVPFGLVPHAQARLLARHLRGDMPDYAPFIIRG